MRRVVVLVAAPSGVAAAPPGVDAVAFARGLVEDTYEAVSDLTGVDVVVAVPEPAAGPTDVPGNWRELVRELLWPGTPLVGFATGRDLEVGAMAGMDEGDAVALVAADAPDLPDLVVANVFSALDTAPVAAAPALRGGLTVLGWRQPAPDWLREAPLGLDTEDAVDRLQARAPVDGLQITRPWRRLRVPSDLGSLDPGLEGWETTRALLSGAAGRARRP